MSTLDISLLSIVALMLSMIDMYRAYRKVYPAVFGSIALSLGIWGLVIAALQGADIDVVSALWQMMKYTGTCLVLMLLLTFTLDVLESW